MALVPMSGAPQEGQQEQSDEATPQEQEQYDRFLMAAGKLMFEDDKSHTAIVATLTKEKDDPPMAIARAAVAVTVQVDQASGGKEPVGLIVRAATEITEQIGEIANSSGVFEVNENVIGKAGQQMLILIADQYGISKEEIQQLMSELPNEEIEKARAQQDEIANSPEAQAAAPAQPQPVVPPGPPQ